MTIFTPKNILTAYCFARRSRRKKQEVYIFDRNLELNLLNMLKDLKERKYKHNDYKQIVLYDTKKRYIYSPYFQDHILHHMTYMQIYNILDNKMTHSTFACRKGYGAHKAVLCLKKLINRETKKFQRDGINEDLYYLKIDFSKYFFSINHQILKDKLRKYIDNEEVLYLLDLIIDSYSTNNRYDSLLKHYDFYINETGKGLPIGGVISQILANFYLNDLDQYIKHKLKLRFVRYMDDVVILGTKNELNFTKNKIMEFIGKEKLILNPQKISFNLVRDGIKFVGYKIKDSKIFVGKKIKKSFLVFTDFLNDMKYRNYNLTLCDVKRIDSMYFSRTGCFKITDFGENFVRCRENTDFLRGGNANNAANAGIFTLNLNRTATNQNRNVGFRCS